MLRVDDDLDDDGPDFLEELIAGGTMRAPELPALLAEARRKREPMRVLRTARKRRKLSQKDVAKAMGTTQPAVSRLESNFASDARLSTFEKYAGALGSSVQFRLVASEQATDLPAVVVEHRP